MLRKLLIVAALFWAMAQLGTFSGLHAGEATNAMTMVAFGFIILAAYTLGALAEKIHLPHITGYLLAGVACGPHFMGLLDGEVVHQLKLFDTLAIALIAMEAGASLDLRELRRQLRQVLVLSALLAAVALAIGLAFAGVTSGVLPAIALPFLDGAPLGVVAAVGLLLGVVFLAASPPVTMAVMSEVRAKGPLSRLVLTLVIFIDVVVVVLLAAILSVIPSLLGEAGAGMSSGALFVLQEFAWSALLGVATAVLAALALRHLEGDALLAIVGLSFVVSWVGRQVHASQLLTFIIAGVVLANATKQGHAFHAVATRLAGPVFVLFFTLLGADLHVDAVEALAGFAVAMVLLRLAGYNLAIRLSQALTTLPDSFRRVGFLGLAPQAGIALAVAATVGRQYPDWGMEFQTLAFSAIALNEMVGPILLKVSLSLAGEARADEPAPAEAEAPPAQAPVPDEPPPPRLSQWLPEPGRPDFDPWGGPPGTGERRLDELCRELQRDLDVMVRDLRSGVVASRRETAQSFVQLLRKEFLRTHRRALVLAADPRVDDDALWAALSRERGELAARWKGLLLDRAASVDFRRERKAVSGLLDAVERSCQALPGALTFKLEPRHLAVHEGDGRALVARKRLAQVNRGVGRLFGRAPVRVVEVRAIARYVMTGRLPVLLRDAVGMLVLEERFLLAQSRNLFEVYDHALDEIIAQGRARDEGEGEGEGDGAVAWRQELLGRLRDELEEELRLMAEGVDRFADETVRVSASSLGRAYRELVGKVAIAGTPALPPTAYRFSRIYEHSVEATASLLQGLDHARDHTRGNAAALAMELDVVRLTEAVRADTERVATETGRDVRGRMSHQLHRVQAAMDDAVLTVSTLLGVARGNPSADLLVEIEEALAPLEHIVDEVVGISQQYRGAIRTQTPFEGLMGALTASVEGLTDRFLVVFDASGPTGRGIPPAPHTVEVPFRELVRAFIEAETGRELAELAARLQGEVDEFARGVEEIDRMLVFQGELARAELEAIDDRPVHTDTLSVLDESLTGTLRRLARKANELERRSQDLAEEVTQRVLQAVLGNLDRLRDVLVTGQVSEIRTRVTQRTLAQGRRELRSAATRAAGLAGQVVALVRATLGEDALHEARKIVGLRDTEAETPIGPAAFAPPAERVEIPTAYRRLFSDRALEAGDMLAGREDEVARLREVLLGRGLGASRAVAVVGVGGMGQGSVMQALVRGLGERARVHRVELETPGMDEVEVDELLAMARQAAQHQRPTIIMVDGFRWLFDIRPHGFDLLRRFVAGVVETSDRVGWLVAAERPVWSYADRAVPLHDAFPERMDLVPLDVEALRRAILERHAMSGYQLEFRRPEDNLAWWLREVLAPRALERRIFEDHYFHELHKDCGGVLRDALHLWMSSIAAIDSDTDTVWVGTPPQPPIRALRELPDDLLITLRQVARSGRITPENHAIQFQVPPEMSRALLTRLAHWGLLRRNEGGSFCFRDEMAGAIYRVLRERRLVG